MTEKEALRSLVRRFPDFETWDISKQLPLIAWFLLRACNKEIFGVSDVKHCLEDYLHIKPVFRLSIELSRCPDIVRCESGNTLIGYALHWRIRDKYDQQLLSTARAIQINKLLKDLPAKIPIAEEKTFLEETLTCYESGANRAAIVMCWNLAFSHLCNFILKDTSRLTTFNQELLKKFPKAKAINVYDDFSPFKESEVLEVCHSAKLINKNQYTILKEKLNNRNMAAHPSTVIFTQIDVEHYILHLINNVVLGLK